jgi:hypothetical protein
MWSSSRIPAARSRFSGGTGDDAGSFPGHCRIARITTGTAWALQTLAVILPFACRAGTPAEEDPAIGHKGNALPPPASDAETYFEGIWEIDTSSIDTIPPHTGSKSFLTFDADGTGVLHSLSLGYEYFVTYNQWTVTADPESGQLQIDLIGEYGNPAVPREGKLFEIAKVDEHAFTARDSTYAGARLLFRKCQPPHKPDSR